MTENKILADTQTGFRNGFRCTDTVHKIVSICPSKNETTAMIFLDFRKAFDRVDRTLLIKKLKHNGYDMMALKVIMKATGKDGISVAMLKKTLPFTLNVLTDMLNRLWFN